MDIEEINAVYPLQFCIPFLCSNPHLESGNRLSGTVTLVKHNGKNYGITCQHVIDGFRTAQQNDGAVKFFLGQTEVTVENDLIGEDSTNDLAVLDLTSHDESMLSNSGDISSTFCSYHLTEEVGIRQDDFVVLGGYPGEYRGTDGPNYFCFGSLSYGEAYVAESSESSIRIEIDTENDESIFAHPNHRIPEHFGGMSGGPIFVSRESIAGVHSFYFAGIIKEQSEMMGSVIGVPIRHLDHLLPAS